MRYSSCLLIIFLSLTFSAVKSETSYDTCQYLNSNTDGFNWYRDGIVLASGANISLATPYTIGAKVGGNGIGFSKSNGTLSLKCDICLSDSTAIGSGILQGTSTGISGTHSLIFDGNVTLSGNLSIGYPLVIDGHGHDLDFYDFYNHAQRYIRLASSFSSLEFRNIVLKNFQYGTFGPLWASVSNSKGLVFENTVIDLTGDVEIPYIYAGAASVLIKGITVIRGKGHKLILWTPITIAKDAVLYIDKNVTLEVRRGVGFTMQDSTSTLYLDDCNVMLDNGTNGGSNIVISNGIVLFDNNVLITDNTSTTSKYFEIASTGTYQRLAAAKITLGGTASFYAN